MEQRRLIRRGRYVASFLATAIVVATFMAGSVTAVPGGGAKTYTGCLTTQGGTLILVKEGQSPQKPCPSGTQLVRFGEGDITSITAGTGLSGGGTNGDVTLQVAESYRLPQTCDANQIAVWNGSAWVCGDDQVGDTLPDCGLGDAVTWIKTDTSLGEWGCQQFAYADQTCDTGDVVTGVDAFGEIECGSGGSGGSLARGYVDRSGVIPLAGSETVASLDLPAGTYLVFASGVLESNNISEYASGSCDLFDSSTGVLSVFGNGDSTSGNSESFALNDWITLASPQTIELTCDELHADIQVYGVELVAIPVSGLN